MQRPLAAHIVDAHELEQRSIDETHADSVPHIHRRQIRDYRQSAAETVRGGEEIEHCGYACGVMMV